MLTKFTFLNGQWLNFVVAARASPETFFLVSDIIWFYSVLVAVVSCVYCPSCALSNSSTICRNSSSHAIKDHCFLQGMFKDWSFLSLFLLQQSDNVSRIKYHVTRRFGLWGNLVKMSVSLTVMTFNLLEDQLEDSPNSWDKRKDLCVSVITSYSPMILCTQQGSFGSWCLISFSWNGWSGFFLYNCVLEVSFAVYYISVWSMLAPWNEKERNFSFVLWWWWWCNFVVLFGIRCEVTVGLSSTMLDR